MRKIVCGPLEKVLGSEGKRPLTTLNAWKENLSLQQKAANNIGKRLLPNLKRKKNPYSYLQPNETSPNHIGSPNHHMANLMLSYGGLLTGKDDHAWPTSSPISMADGFWCLLVDRLQCMVVGAVPSRWLCIRPDEARLPVPVWRLCLYSSLPMIQALEAWACLSGQWEETGICYLVGEQEPAGKPYYCMVGWQVSESMMPGRAEWARVWPIDK